LNNRSSAASGASPGMHTTGPPRVCCRAAPPGPSEIYAALWLGALLIAAGELPDPLPPQIEELARRYFERFPPDVKA
jgi:hypothetical protein